MKKLILSILAVSVLAGCAELQNVGKSAKDGAMVRAQVEASSKASEAVGKVFGSK